MHPAVFAEFDAICRDRNVRGAVLEIGATPDESTLLNLPALAGATGKIGINKAGDSEFGDFKIMKGDANRMVNFADQSFDAVLCNAVLEHDPFFWKTLAEIRRVVRIGGLVVIGTPGYAQLGFEKRLRRWAGRLAFLSGNPDGWALQHATFTLSVHNFPGDYYRFSEQTFREVFFEGMQDVRIRSILVPPRIIGSGIRA
jgi:SAM-dependent methyltransferase